MKSPRLYLSVLTAALLLTVSCKKDNTRSKQDIIDVSYGADNAQKMDVYLPANRSTENTKVLVLVHGGAWTSGDKSEFSDAIASLRLQLTDYAIFNVNYRLATLSGANLAPSQVEDVNSAIDFIANKSVEYQINSNKIVMVGASAGAQLSLLQAYRFNASGRIKAVVDLFGPTDIADLYNAPPDVNYPSMLAIWMGGTPATNYAAYAGASPIVYVTPQAPPTIIFHGTVDNIVPIRQSDSLQTHLQRAGVIHQYFIYPGEGHGWTGTKITDTYTKAIAFIRQNVH